MIFIDTGAFSARYLRKDQHHRSAVAFWNKLGSNRKKCVTSNFVLDETFTLLGRWAGYDFAVQRAKNVYASQALSVCRPDRKDEINALQYFAKICGSACQLYRLYFFCFYETRQD